MNLQPVSGLYNVQSVDARIIGWVLLTPIVLATAYMLLEIWLFDLDPCSPFICTEGIHALIRVIAVIGKTPPE